MYAVIATGGKQYRVSPGDTLRIERLDKEPGDTIDIQEVLMVKDEKGTRIGAPLVLDTVVRCTVVRNSRSRKVIVFKKKPRKGFKRTRGHRQHFTEIRVNDISSLAPSRPATRQE